MKRRPQLSLDFRKRTRAGKLAKKPGRMPTGKRRDPRHRLRPEVLPREPLRGALARCAARADYRIVHISIQGNHI